MPMERVTGPIGGKRGGVSLASLQRYGFGINRAPATKPDPSGLNAIAIGNIAIAAGVRSVAIGEDADSSLGIASVAIGCAAWVKGTTDGAVALGENTQVADGADHAIAIGNGAIITDALGHGCIAIGGGSEADNTKSIAIGELAFSEDQSVALGDRSDAGGVSSIAIGSAADTGTDVGSIAIGDTALVGSDAVATGGIAIGHDALVYEVGGIAIGLNAETGKTGGAVDVHSIAVGKNALADSEGSVAIGGGITTGAQARTDGAIAIGGEDGIGAAAQALEDNTIAIGNSSQAGQDPESSTENTAVALGWAAKAYEVGGIAIGAGAESGLDGFTASPSAISIGDNSQASGEDSISIGFNSITEDLDCVAVGHNADTEGLHAIAIGNAWARDDYCMAIGAGSQAGDSATSMYATALGANTLARWEGCIAIGGSDTAGALCGFDACIAIGGKDTVFEAAIAYEDGCIAIGTGAEAGQTLGMSTEHFAVALGYAAKAFEATCIAIGTAAEAGLDGFTASPAAIAIGEGAKATAITGLAIGFQCMADHPDAMVFGLRGQSNGEGHVTFNHGNVNFQHHIGLLYVSTGGNSVTPLETAEGNEFGILIPVETTYAIKGIAVARTAANLSAYWTIEALVSNTAGTTTLVNSTVTKIHDATAGITLAAAIDNTEDSFQLDATGIVATTIRWGASLQITEIIL